MASATQLSLNDSAVLSALFDPEASLDGAPRISTTVKGVNNYDDSTLEKIQRAEREALLMINTERPAPSDIRASISQLSKLVEEYPEHASLYNNRAQAQRMLLEKEPATKNAATMTQILDDLAQAIKLASPRHPNSPVSSEQAKVLASAHTHRAFLLYVASRSDAERSILSALPEYSNLDKEALEEIASRDFGAGGRYGNKLAKQLAVQTNPYAKLCGSIVKEALRKEVEDYVAGRQIVA